MNQMNQINNTQSSNFMYMIGFILYVMFYVPYLVFIHFVEIMKYLIIFSFLFLENTLIFMFRYLKETFEKTYPVIIQNIKNISNDLIFKYNQISNIIIKINDNVVMFKNDILKFF